MPTPHGAAQGPPESQPNELAAASSAGQQPVQYLHLCAHAGLGQWASGLLWVPGTERVRLLRRRLRPVLLQQWRHRLLLRRRAPGERMPRSCQTAAATAIAAAAARPCGEEAHAVGNTAWHSVTPGQHIVTSHTYGRTVKGRLSLEILL